AHPDDIQETDWLGATLLYDGELAAATGKPAAPAGKGSRTHAGSQSECDQAAEIRFAAGSPLRFTDAKTYPFPNLVECPAVRWSDHLGGDARLRMPARDVV